MKNFKSVVERGCQGLKKFLREKWDIFMLGCLLLLYLKIPFKFLFQELNFLLGYNFLCGLYAILVIKVITFHRGKEVFHSRARLLTSFFIAVLFSYLAVNYSIYEIISSWF